LDESAAPGEGGGGHVPGHPQVQSRYLRGGGRRAESGIGQVLKQSPGFQGYFVFDAGGGVGGSVSLFKSREAAIAVNEKALAWIRATLIDDVNGEPEITMGEVLAIVPA
jgi:hypothetical protein